MAKILIVDDSSIVTRILSGYLITKGHSVHVSNSPFGVTNKVREMQPDIVLMDLGLPGLSGNSLLEMIRKLQNIGNTRIIIISSSEERTMKELVMKGEADDYFIKGGDIKTLDLKIAYQLERSAKSGNHAASLPT